MLMLLLCVAALVMVAFFAPVLRCKVLPGLGLTLAAGAASAQTAYDGITGAVDFTDVTTAVLAVFALIAAVYVAFKGGKIILRAVRGA